MEVTEYDRKSHIDNLAVLYKNVHFMRIMSVVFVMSNIAETNKCQANVLSKHKP